MRVMGQTGMGLAVGIVLARLLPVADFGVMAMAMVFVLLAEQIASLGLGAALIQREELQGAHIETALALSFVMATLFSLAYWWLAPYAAIFFHEPRLTSVMQALAIGQWFSVTSMVPRDMLRRRLAFKRLFFIELGSYGVGYGAVGIALALWGWGVWSLVVGTCSWFILGFVWLSYAAHLPRPRLHVQASRDLLGFGLGVSGKSLIWFIGNQAATVIAGRFLDPYQVGLYWRAAQLANLPSQKIALTFSQAMFPIYARLQKDTQQMEQAYLRTVSAVGFLALPLLAGAAAAPEWVITGLYGEKWREAAPVFSYLCLAAMLGSGVTHLSGAVIEALGRVQSEVWRQAVWATILVAGYLLAAMHYHSIVLMAGVTFLGSLWLYVSLGTLCLWLLHSTWYRYLEAQWGGVCLALGVAVAAWGTGHWLEGVSREAGLGIIVAVCGAVYLIGFVGLSDRYTFGAKGWVLEWLDRRTG